ncbi:RidA family protein [Neptuniibacter caesariensis]|uniref:Translation initiation inhibitor n=1 Tax=Neptuniibacter caesariensis TaxID=207954 RepID=A0A7U8GSZ6_NEPCE|nr:RidA family protein [Neptuniibacter caesariensis]EAR61916.1 translation initiation inhibitor [Oceanospirillum sp. MED92] [Neptuniibacter caesariensis]
MLQRQHSNQRMSQLVTFGNLVWTAGQVAQDPSQDMAGQTQQILNQIDKLLADAGTEKRHLISANIWVSDIAQFAQMNEIWDAWVDSENAPVRACVESRLARPELLVEIQVVAAKPA